MKHVISILINGTVFCFIWILGSLLSNALLGVNPPPPENPSSGLLLIWITCLLEAGALHIFMLHNRQSRLNRGVLVFAIIMMLQYVFSQMETIYYLDSETIPNLVVLATMVTGLISTLAFTIFLSFRYPLKIAEAPATNTLKQLLPMIILLGVVVYPLIYFFAGYFIAWQSEAVRMYYNGSAELVSFFEVMRSNIQSGVYTFQAFRGIIWTVLGLFIIKSLSPMNWQLQGVILGLLFAVLMNAQLLIPNPYMPVDVRTIHAIETASSNFIWGMIICFADHLLLKKNAAIPRVLGS